MEHVVDSGKVNEETSMADLKRLWPFTEVSYLAVFLSVLCFMVLSTSAQPGFISIDCGITTADEYTDSNNISWVSDTGYISTGKIANVPDPYQNLTSRRFKNVRYFPENIPKNCYDLSPVTGGEPYIVRARFYYGNYDNNSSPPDFSLIVDATVMVSSVSGAQVETYEMYVVAKSSSINVCLARSAAMGAGNPFISSLELRNISSSNTYFDVLKQGYGLFSVYPLDFGGNYSNILRYPYDIYDRFWNSVTLTESNFLLETKHEVTLGTQAQDLPPQVMLQTASTGPSIPYNLDTISSSSQYHVIMFFAEIDPNVTGPGQRVFDIYSNSYRKGTIPWASSIDIFNMTGGQYIGTELYSPSPVTPSDNSLLITFKPSLNFTYAPIISGMQVLLYTPSLMSNLTHPNDAQAISLIRDFYGIQGSSGDPCLPMDIGWTWISCDITQNPARIISINLSNSSLKGAISPDFNSLSALTKIYLDNNTLTDKIPDLSFLSDLQTLELQNNRLSGTIPASLADLQNLTVLYLQNNNLQGDVPATLLEKAAENKLDFRYDGNSQLTTSAPPPPSNTTKSLPSPQSPPSPNLSSSLKINPFLLMYFLIFMFSLLRVI